MRKFNLIEESWIPVRFLDGRRDELGISDALLRSREIAAIEDQSPLVVAALHRFLLALLYRALEGPTDIEQAKALFKAGLPHDKITAYLKKWEDRFWLFDDKYPFAQIPTFEPKTWRTWPTLAAEHNADNAKVLFDHVDVQNPGSVTEAKAIQWILAVQTFSVSSGKSELSHTGTAPSATSIMALPLGRNLSDTLLFSLVPENREIIKIDLPVWERPMETLEELNDGIERLLSGYADRYTWRSRSIRLNEESAGGVSKVAFASGVGVLPSDQSDPMSGYRIDIEKGKLPLQFRERGFWRDYDSLLPDDSKLGPRVIEQAALLCREDRSRYPGTVMVLGQANKKAKIEFWRLEYFMFPPVMVNDKYVRIEIRQLLEIADVSQKSLWKSCSSFARDILGRGERTLAKKDISAFVDQMVATPFYWSTLESRFHEILYEYTLDRDPDDIRHMWLVSVKNALNSAWTLHCSSVSAGDVWSIRALVRSEGPVLEQIKKLNKEIDKFKPEVKS
ncbi:MAG: type I-E CRISPR-associated protein Cse1/CasA [Syntrophales bacterium]